MVPYFHHSPLVPIHVARLRFLANDPQGAIAITDQALSKVEEIKRVPNAEVHPEFRAIFSLNKAFLAFYRARWAEATEAFGEMLANPACRGLDWDDVVAFADLTADREVCAGTSFLQVLYRRIGKKEVPPEMLLDAMAWLKEDKSRKPLESLLLKPIPRQQLPKSARGLKKRGKRKRRRK